MALRIVEVLQRVLDAPQENIGLRELERRGLRQLLALGEHRQHGERRTHGKRGIAAAADELQRLRDELDLADAARPELHMAGELAPLDVAAHFGVQAAHGVERGVVQVLAKDERAHDLVELIVRAAGKRPGLDPRIALPFAALGDEVLLEEVVARDERPRVAVRAQAHVDAEHEAVLGHIGKEPHQPARRRFQARRLFRPRMQEHQIDVGRNVELAAAELAHADDHQLRRAEPVERRCDRELREVAHRAADFLQRRGGIQVARHHPQKHPFAQPPQAALESRFIVCLGTFERGRHLGAREGGGLV